MRLFASILLCLLLVPSWSGAPRLALLGDEASIIARPVQLDSKHPRRRRVGDLLFLGGVALSSGDPAFGGFSALAVEGEQFTLLSDGGNVVTFRMTGDWRPRAVQFANLPDGPGTGWTKVDRDSESLAVDPATGDRLVGFETYNEIWRYDRAFRRPLGRARPRPMQAWEENAGAEALVRLRSGEVLVIDEGNGDVSTRERPALLFGGDPTRGAPLRARFAYRPPAGYSPSDAAELPGGDLIVLNRRFDLPYRFRVLVTRVPREAMQPGAVVTGRAVARFDTPVLHDNYEGVTATEEDGATILWIVADDNQSVLQRSLLLKFRLLEPE